MFASLKVCGRPSPAACHDCSFSDCYCSSFVYVAGSGGLSLTECYRLCGVTEGNILGTPDIDLVRESLEKSSTWKERALDAGYIRLVPYLFP